MLDKSSIVSVVIVNYNAKEYLRSCLCSIKQQSYRPFEVIVIDNASSDGSLDMLDKEFPEVTSIKNSVNEYFAKAYNQGIAYSKTEFVLCLNNDIVLDRDFIKSLIEKRDLDSRIGMWGGKLLRMDKQTIDTTGQFLGRNRRPIERGYSRPDKGEFNKEEYVFGICAAAVLFRKKILEEVKVDGEYFDEDFGALFEDLDLSWRANRFGWRAYYVPEALGFHKRGGSIQTIEPKHKLLRKFAISHLPPELQKSLIRNRYLAIIKNDTWKEFIKNFIFIIAYDIMISVYMLIFNPRIFIGLSRDRAIFKRSFAKRKIIRGMLIKLGKA